MEKDSSPLLGQGVEYEEKRYEFRLPRSRTSIWRAMDLGQWFSVEDCLSPGVHLTMWGHFQLSQRNESRPERLLNTLASTGQPSTELFCSRGRECRDQETLLQGKVSRRRPHPSPTLGIRLPSENLTSTGSTSCTFAYLDWVRMRTILSGWEIWG